MPSFALIPHPSTPCPWVRRFTAEVQRLPAGALHLAYQVEGDIAQLQLPHQKPPARTDGLWRDTCFEAFLRAPGSAAYDEFNFSPSGEWAAYRFDRYRSGMLELELGSPPVVVLHRHARQLSLAAEIGASDAASQDLLLALSAVLRDQQGTVSYWALLHPAAKPDFHDAAGFAATLT